MTDYQRAKEQTNIDTVQELIKRTKRRASYQTLQQCEDLKVEEIVRQAFVYALGLDVVAETILDLMPDYINRRLQSDLARSQAITESLQKILKEPSK